MDTSAQPNAKQQNQSPTTIPLKGAIITKSSPAAPAASSAPTSKPAPAPNDPNAISTAAQTASTAPKPSTPSTPTATAPVLSDAPSVANTANQEPESKVPDEILDEKNKGDALYFVNYNTLCYMCAGMSLIFSIDEVFDYLKDTDDGTCKYAAFIDENNNIPHQLHVRINQAIDAGHKFVIKEFFNIMKENYLLYKFIFSETYNKSSVPDDFNNYKQTFGTDLVFFSSDVKQEDTCDFFRRSGKESRI